MNKHITMRQSLAVLILVFFGFACSDTRKMEKLQTTVDSLTVELEQRQLFVETLVQVGQVLDSIDVSRNNLRLSLEEGMNFEEYTSRLQDLNEYVKNAENRLGELTTALGSSSRTIRTYEKSIEALKQRTSKQAEEIQQLTVDLESTENENEALLTFADIQLGQIDDLTRMLNEKQQELELTQNRIDALWKQSKVNEADALFARAMVTEEAASRTKLAPKKKKETYREALELYQRALELGHDGAEVKINELQKKI
jgi:tetratricopeptide (TPR) repeat protein